MNLTSIFPRFSNQINTTTSTKARGFKFVIKTHNNSYRYNRRQFSANSKNNAFNESSSNESKKKTFFEWYEYHLQTSPYRTKMITGGILWGIGDAVAQVLVKEDTQTKSSSNSNYDIVRTGRAIFFGFAIHAPTAHIHYNFLETLTTRLNIPKTNALYVPIFKAFMEQFVYWSWFSNSLYHGTMGALQGMSSRDIYQRICDVLWETQKAQWVFWIPIQIVNFRYVPVRHQLNVVLITSVIWTAFLSFAFPPVADDNDDEHKITDIKKK